MNFTFNLPIAEINRIYKILQMNRNFWLLFTNLYKALSNYY